jgi:NTE family protein
MYHDYKNLVFEGGGVLSVAYLGAIDYLDEAGILSNIKRVAGSSSGAISACLTCFNIPFSEITKMASSIDYKKVTEKRIVPLRSISDEFKNIFERLFGDINSIYRLVNNYGWYSTNYFYNWIKKIIASQFDQSKKKPPYTFEDFKNNDIHINNSSFKDLYIIGTDISYKAPVIFSYDTTPKMEVAEAIRISISIPLLFEAIKIENKLDNKTINYVYADGGIMRNYPINLFDNSGVNYETLGIQLVNKATYKETKNIVDYISNLFVTILKVQENIYNYDPTNAKRTISINTGGISPIDFNISDQDQKFLYKQGYESAEDYFNESERFMY